MESKKNSLNRQDLINWWRNTLTFLIPALIVFLTAVSTGVSIDKALIAVYLRWLNTMIDLLKKYQKDNTLQNNTNEPVANDK